MIAIFDPADSVRGALRAISTNALWLGLTVWGVTSAFQGEVGAGRVALLAVASLGWVLWIAARVRNAPWLGLPSWLLMAAAGGALSPHANSALVFVGVGALAAGMVWPAERSGIVAAVGPVATLISAWVGDTGLLVAAWSTMPALGGLTLGIARRETQERTAQRAQVQISEARADAERARAELLAGRNHLARELHDILAHTLSALSLQLEALNAVLGSGSPQPPEVQAQMDGLRRLVREGLDDARGAVQALREDLPPLEDQLAKLAGDRHASLHVDGDPRRLSPEVSLALYRVAQEALTNVTKHAPGACTDVDLAFAQDRVRLVVCNGPANGSANGSKLLAATGSGYGLQGIRERVLLIGGTVDAGPAEGGWRVEAEVPA